MSFTYKSLVVGPFIPKQKTTITFPYTGNITIVAMASSCGCSTPVNHPDKSQITVEFDVPDIPVHILAQGNTSFVTEKKVIVKYYITDPNNITEETLTFKATIVKRK